MFVVCSMMACRYTVDPLRYQWKNPGKNLGKNLGKNPGKNPGKNLGGGNPAGT